MRVLVVEDMPRFANRIAEGLRDQGMAVDVAYDGDEAAMKINVNPYDVVVLDRDLPGIHGDQLCQMITASHHPAMILMLTAAGAPDDRVAGLALGADDYLAKPFHFPELVLRIRALARRKPTTHRGTLQAAGLELDPLTGTVSRTVEQSTSPPRNGPSSKRCSRPAPPDSLPRSCSSRRGTKTPIRSPTPSRSRSPGSDANLASPKLSRRLPASDTGSRAQPPARGVSGPRA
jgi:CheY-like chemotaxis protein